MADTPFIARGFRGRRPPAPAGRLPPGQYETHDFPVLSAGPTPRLNPSAWDFVIGDASGGSARWSWNELLALSHETPIVDIHCVTKWSKFDTKWEGISVDTLLDLAHTRGVASGEFVLAFCDGGYTTNLPLADVTGAKAWVAFGYDGAPLPPEHGGPARAARAAPVFLEERQVGARVADSATRRAGASGSRPATTTVAIPREQRYQGDP